MFNSGYVYILINPSIEGMVKIGKTKRDPENRVAELSSATGVPTPFILVYKEYFSDCSSAEAMVHDCLNQLGKRVSSNREFFQLPVWEAVQVIQNVKNHIGSNDEVPEQNDIEDLLDVIMSEANAAYYGEGDHLVDYKKALALYKKAAKMGSAAANVQIGNMYRSGTGCKEDLDTAIHYYQEGARLGDNWCNAYLGNIFWNEKKHIENGNKCWRFFFNNINSNDMASGEEYQVLEYIRYTSELGIEMEHKNKIVPFRDQLIKRAVQEKSICLTEVVDEFGEDFGHYLAKKYDDIIFFLKTS